jgi:hypothetical protein
VRDLGTLRQEFEAGGVVVVEEPELLGVGPLRSSPPKKVP